MGEGSGEATWVKILTSYDPEQSCGIGTFTVEKIDMRKLSDVLFEKHKIHTAPMEIPATDVNGEEIMGIRVTPSIYTTLQELDVFIEAVSNYIKNGLPT